MGGGLAHCLIFPFVIKYGSGSSALLGTNMIKRGWVNTAGLFPKGHRLVAKGTTMEQREGVIFALFHFSGVTGIMMGLAISELTKRRIPIPKAACYIGIASGIPLALACPTGGYPLLSIMGLNMLLNYSDYDQKSEDE